MFVNEDIREIEKGLFLVHGAVIEAVSEGQYDSDEGRADLVKLADGIKNGTHYIKPYGDLTVFTFYPTKPRSNGARYLSCPKCHFRNLSDAAKNILRGEFPEHAGEF